MLMYIMLMYVNLLYMLSILRSLLTCLFCRNLLIQRGILRYLVIVVDTTLSMTGDKVDFAPLSRWQVTHRIVSQWIQEYADQNPMSQIAGIELTDEGQAEVWSAMDGRAPVLLERWKELSGTVARRLKVSTGTSSGASASSGSSSSKANGGGGVVSGAGSSGALTAKRNNPSLQKGLEMALNILHRYPSHASREIICLMADTSTNDPSNLAQTIAKVANQGIRASVISLAAETRIFKHVAESTTGDYYVILDEHHYEEIMMAMALPPPRIVLDQAVAALKTSQQMIPMAFPKQVIKGNNEPCLW